MTKESRALPSSGHAPGVARRGCAPGDVPEPVDPPKQAIAAPSRVPEQVPEPVDPPKQAIAAPSRVPEQVPGPVDPPTPAATAPSRVPDVPGALDPPRWAITAPGRALEPVPRPADPARQAALAEPSWARVLGTTVRLWLERRVLGRWHREGESRRRHRLAGVVLLVAVVFAAGALTVALYSGVTAPAGRDPGKGGPGRGPLARAAAYRRQAAAWITAQVSLSAIVACDPLMCAALQADHFPVGNLLELSPDSAVADPLGSAIVVATDAIRSEFGQRLADVYAPVVIASFGAGTARVDVRVTAPDGAVAYLADLRADLANRQASGEQLLGNQHLLVSAAARRDLATGQVDSRLLITLPELTAELRVDVLAFGDVGPRASSGVPMRYAEIAVRQLSGGQQSIQLALSVLRQQQAPFRAASMTVAHVSGQPVLRIEYAAPSPLGLLLGAGAP